MFHAGGASYDLFMGRYSAPLAAEFVDALNPVAGQQVLDVGCGPGALTSALATRLGPAAVAACDPSPGFVDECAKRNPGVEVQVGKAEAIPFTDARFDLAAAQLVLHFVANAPAAADELRRVVRPGGTVAACVWDAEREMDVLRAFWDAVHEVDPDVSDTTRELRFGRPGEIARLFVEADLVDINETTIEVHTTYVDFDEVWTGFQAGIGPAGAHCVALPALQQALLRDRLYEQLGSPPGPITLTAVARSVTAIREVP
ncbi:MAG TPA: SAM-dependent methyltransferase [Candidatus Microthrix parvicella]|jgi:SAM-dependent methyltransferase|uniref:class I SAM-dependent methyltransferase n=1 Tax=Candidatus Neomicrothrix parvicella TaxID=41950 RepID=UPI00037AFE81|nr:methyltransferase domain-containing protein [Candidatus Microthrix parvicella]HBX10629.1 SAM-dependent methyltransferase [Candidatus Microthrix parvicella]